MDNKRRFFKSLIESGRNIFKELCFRHTLPKNPRHDDLYLVEFPKSGITWLSFIFANIILLETKNEKEVNFFNCTDWVPDINSMRHLAQDANLFHGFRLIKSHSEFNPFYNKVIYLVRNPLDVMISYYNFQTQLSSFQGGFDDFLKNQELGMKAWRSHLQGWMESPPSISFLWIRYEDLRENTISTLQRLFTLCGEKVDDDLLVESVKRCSIQNMRQLELDYAFGNRPHLKNFQFVGKKDGMSRDLVSSAQIEFIRGYLNGLEFLGYES